MTALATLISLSNVTDLHGIVVGALGISWYLLISRSITSPAGRWAIFSAAVILASLITHLAAHRIGETDPSSIVLDELIVIPFVFAFYQLKWARPDLLFVPFGLLVFGLFDLRKPLGLVYLEALPGGVGIVADDLGAALYAGAIVWVGMRAYRRCFRAQA